MVNLAARIRANGESAKRYDRHTPVCKVKCQGCGNYIYSDQSFENIEYVKTKRGTEIFFHRDCMDDIWRRKIP
jgi:hypothetical protein